MRCPATDQLYTMGNNATYEVALAQGTTVRIDMVQIRTARGDDLGRLWLAQDITERRRRERTLERLATTDTLTGLTNRRAFMARLEAEITHIAHGAPPAAFLMLNLDHFKRVNDTWGHATGDKVLVHLANLLRGNLATQGRHGGTTGWRGVCGAVAQHHGGARPRHRRASAHGPGAKHHCKR